MKYLVCLYGCLVYLLLCPCSFAQTCKYPDILWFEYGSMIKEKDGSVTQEFGLYTGDFIKEKTPLKSADSLEVYCSVDGKSFLKPELKEILDGYVIRVTTFGMHRFTLYADVLLENSRCYAKTDFMLYGPDKKEKLTGALEHETPFYEIEVKGRSYWPQTGLKLKIQTLAEGRPDTGREVFVMDKNFGITALSTDKKGEALYIPPEDKELNRQGETAFKESIIAAHCLENKKQCTATYTLLLHRSRYGNNNYVLGSGIAMFSFLSVFAWISHKRKKFKI